MLGLSPTCANVCPGASIDGQAVEAGLSIGTAEKYASQVDECIPLPGDHIYSVKIDGGITYLYYPIWLHVVDR